MQMMYLICIICSKINNFIEDLYNCSSHASKCYSIYALYTQGTIIYNYIGEDIYIRIYI